MLPRCSSWSFEHETNERFSTGTCPCRGADSAAVGGRAVRRPVRCGGADAAGGDLPRAACVGGPAARPAAGSRACAPAAAGVADACALRCGGAVLPVRLCARHGGPAAAGGLRAPLADGADRVHLFDIFWRNAAGPLGLPAARLSDGAGLRPLRPARERVVRGRLAAPCGSWLHHWAVPVVLGPAASGGRHDGPAAVPHGPGTDGGPAACGLPAAQRAARTSLHARERGSGSAGQRAACTAL